MRRLFRRSIWFVPLVIVPVGALLVMQYRFLRRLEETSVSAERNWQRGAIERVAEDIDDSLRRQASAAISLSYVQLVSTGTLGNHFREHRVPGAKLYFATRFADDGEIDTRFYDPGGALLEGWWHSDAEAVKMAMMPWHAAHRWQRVAEPKLQVDERDPRARIVQRPILDESMHVVGVAGVVLDQKVSRKNIAAMASALLKERYPKRIMYVRIGDDVPRRDYISQPLGFVFTSWRIGVRDACTSPEELAAQQFRNNMMWTGGAFIVLLGGIGLGAGSVARQMRLSQMKSDFVSNVSHELRTPLSSIRVFGEYMRLGRVTKEEKIRQYGEYIETESRRLTALINNILDFSKIESAEKQYRFCATDVVALVEQTVEAFEVPLRDAGVSIAFASEGARPPLLLVDKDALGQVLVNLLDNAVKYSGDDRKIDVTVTGARDEVRMRVRDRGIGIPASERKKIFEKFYRVGSGLVHDVKGSGLGLSIVQHVVHAHGGRVEVESEVGSGTAFTIVLPVRTATDVAPMTQELA
ncbi:MAG TPA: HAMP domain-containing sensor histidine kinase [Thermoanaerobaculia bacterium]|jgi:signal transduction histidine kinase|nr:HAMP domain-containing sensor histidine kinase [Thermoanaerobaculia bacterium]